MKFMESKGYGFTVTCHRNRFPVGIKQYLHQEKNKAGDKTAKSMQYENPNVAVRQIEATNEEIAYRGNIMSFQLTGLTNISGLIIRLHFSYIGNCHELPLSSYEHVVLKKENIYMLENRM